MIKLTIQDAEETAEFKVLEKPIIQKPLIAESDVITIDNNLSTYVTGTQKRELTVGLGYLDSAGYETLRRIRDRQYAVLKYPTVTITADEPVDLGYGEDVPDYRQRIVELKGKNLFDKDNPNMLTAYIDITQSVITNNNFNRIVWIPCEPNTTYTVQRLSPPSWNRGLAWTETKPAARVQTYGYVQGNSSSLTITTGATAKYLVYRFYQSNSDSSTTLDNVLASVQIEKGSTATTYEPYYNIELCKIGTYQDYIYKSDDKWYVHKTIGKLELSNPTSITRLNTALTSSQSMYRWAAYYEGETLPTSSSSSELIPIYSSHFEAKTRLNTYNNIQGIAPPAPADTGTQTVIFYVSSLAKSSAEDVTTWLNNNNPVVYYQLATPTDTEITNDTLKAQLDALQNAAFDRWTKVETEVQESSLQPYLTVTQGEITGSGKEVTLDGTTEDLLDFVILGDIYQQTYSGKNKFNEAAADMLVARLNSTGDITTDITNRLCTQGYIPVSPNTTYTFSATPENTSKTLQAYMCGYTEEGSTTAIGNYPSNAWYNLPITFTTGANCNFIRISYRYSDNSTMSATSAQNQQLELGSTATSYEIYVGGTTSPNPDYPQEVQRVNGDITFDFSGPSGVKRYTMVGKMTLADQRIVDNCGTNEQVQVSFRESKQI